LHYVDDFGIGSSDPLYQKHLFNYLSSFYTIKDLGKMKEFIGIQVEQISGKFFCPRSSTLMMLSRNMAL